MHAFISQCNESCWPKAHYYSKSVHGLSGWLTHCHVLIMKACASRSCSTAVAWCLTGRHCGAIVIWNMLSRSCGGDTKFARSPGPFLLLTLSSPCSQRKGLQWWEKCNKSPGHDLLIRWVGKVKPRLWVGDEVINLAVPRNTSFLAPNSTYWISISADVHKRVRLMWPIQIKCCFLVSAATTQFYKASWTT